MKNANYEYIRNLRNWKHDYLRKNRPLDDVMKEFMRLNVEYWNVIGQKQPEHVWLTKPREQSPAHLAVFFERWDVLWDFLQYDDGTHIHPFHRNKFGETILDILHHIKAHERVGLARQCYERICELQKRFCPHHNSILCLGRYCPECQDTIPHIPLIQEAKPELNSRQRRSPLESIQNIASYSNKQKWVPKNTIQTNYTKNAKYVKKQLSNVYYTVNE
jgi:hypothetical protein